jgi:hypothetical protein
VKLLLAGLLTFAGLFVGLYVADATVGLEGTSPWLVVPVILVTCALFGGLAWRLLQERGAASLERRIAAHLPALRRADACGLAFEPGPALDFRFAFVGTREDLLRAERVFRRERTGLRGWVRGLVIGMGLLWLSGFALVGLPELRHGRIGVGPLMWLALGATILWTLVVRPARVRRDLRRRTPATQELELHFTSRAIEVVAAGVGRSERAWGDLLQCHSTPKGVLFAFADALHWLPARVLADPAERQRFEDSLAARIARQVVRLEPLWLAGKPWEAHPLLAQGGPHRLAGLRREPAGGAERSIELTLRGPEGERRLRLHRPLVVRLDEALLEAGNVTVQILRVPHPEVDGLSVLVVDPAGTERLELYAEELEELAD